MGKITSSQTDRYGKTTNTEVRTNKLEDFVLNSIFKIFGREIGWRMIHKLERWKLPRK